jgi:anthranilate 1,2-dioxygenase small subunit
MMTTATAKQTINLAQARDLMARYALALDDGQLEQWPSFFTERCTYRVQSRQNYIKNMPLSIVFCSGHAMMYDRVESVLKANVYEPHQYRHVLSESVVEKADGTAMWLRTSFICVRTMLDGTMLLYAAGEYYDEVVSENGQPRFSSRNVVIESSRVDTLLATPL